MPTVYTSTQIASIIEQLEHIQVDGVPLFQVRQEDAKHVTFLRLTIPGWWHTNTLMLPDVWQEDIQTSDSDAEVAP